MSRPWPLVVLLAVIVAYLGVAAVIVHIASAPVRVTAMDRTPASVGAPFEDVVLRSADDRVDLAAWVLPLEGAEAGIVMVHGIEANRATPFGTGFVDLAGALHRAGYQVLMLDLRGHGASGPGRYAFGLRERHDVVAAVDHLVRERGVRPGSVGVVGVSLGGAAAIEAAAIDGRIGAIWSESTFADVYPVLLGSSFVASALPTFLMPGMRLAYRLRFGVDLARARPADVVAALSPRPLTLVHGERDLLVPVAHARVLAAAAPWADVWVVPGAGHAEAYGADPGLYVLRLVEFFDLAFRTALAVAPD